MSWNKRDYYYQNQMKVLSGTDAEPGYKESDGDSLTITELNKRINGVSGDSTKPGNGLYKLVSLIKAKFEQLRNINWSLIDIHVKDNDNRRLKVKNLNDLDGENSYTATNNAEKDTIGNFFHGYSDGRINDQSKREQLNYPKYLDTKNFSTVLKVSSSDGQGVRSIANDDQGHQGDHIFYARQDLLQNMNPNRYVRLHSGSGLYAENQDLDENNWTPWYVFVPMKEEDAKEIGLIDENGYLDKSWKDLFLRRANDFTNGPTGFGITPRSSEQQDVSESTRAKIVLGKYTYGTELPTDHYAGLDDDIPKGQIYLQYDPQSSEG